MSFTVEDALRLEPLRKAKVVAGKQGLNRVVRFVNIMEVPNVKRWMKGGELLVTAGLAFHEEPELLDTIIDDLDSVHVAAFGIKPGQYLQEIPRKLIDKADEKGLPLIELPEDVPYMDYMIPIFETLISRQYHALKRTEDVHNRLIELVMEGNGIPGICSKLEEILSTPVIVIDKVANCYASSSSYIDNDKHKDWVSPLWENKVIECIEQSIKKEELASHRWNRIPFSEDESSILIVPIEIHGIIENYLVAWEKDIKLSDRDLMALENAATIISLELIKERAIYETEKKIRGDLLEDLINKNYKDLDVVLRRASFSRLNVNNEFAIFVIDIEDFESFFNRVALKNEKYIQSLKEDIVSQVRGLMQRQCIVRPMLVQRSDSLIGLLSIPDKKAKESFRREFNRLLKSFHDQYQDLKLVVGIGTINHGIDLLDKSYREALTSINVGKFLQGIGSVTFFDEIGPYSFLSELGESEFLHKFYRETIGKIKEYDRKHNSDLLPTLEVYFRCNGNLRHTAEQLFLHRNSVVYRMKKIEKISGLSLNSPENQFNLQLAIRIGKIILSEEQR